MRSWTIRTLSPRFTEDRVQRPSRIRQSGSVAELWFWLDRVVHSSTGLMERAELVAVRCWLSLDGCA